MLGDQAQQLITESLRSQQTSSLLAYNTPSVRSLIRESHSLSSQLEHASERFTHSQQTPDEGTSASLTITALSLGRNKRALLVYHQQRLDLLRDKLWTAGGVKSAAYGAASESGRHMTDVDAGFARKYYELCNAFKTSSYGGGHPEMGGEGGTPLDEAVELMAGGVELGPPRELMVSVRATRDVGEVLLPVSLKRVVLSKGSQYYLPRAEVDQFVVSGELEIVQ